MPFRLRKSKQIMPGVRLTLTKSGISARAGVRGLGTSVSTSGRRTTSAGVPGSGVYFLSSEGGGGSRRRTANSDVIQPTAQDIERAVPGAGWFASQSEKAFRKGVIAYVRGDSDEARSQFKIAADGDAPGAELFLGILHSEADEPEEAAARLERTINRQLPDRLMQKYLKKLSLSLGVAVLPQLQVTLPATGESAAILLAQLHRRLGRPGQALATIDRAEGEMQAVMAGTVGDVLRLTRAAAYAELGDWDGVLRTTEGAENVDDVSLATVAYRAAALREKGLPDAAMEMHRETLKSKKRDDSLINLAYYERSKTYEVMGQSKRARKDLETIYSRDREFADVAARLAD